MMKKILIIGGCGYIGSALYNHLSTLHHVNTVDLEWFGNYSNSSNLRKDFNSLDVPFLNSFDTVILVAANSSVPLCTDLHAAFENNVVKFINLAKKINKQKFIYASSSCVYTSMSSEPKDEAAVLTPLDGLTLTKTTIDHFMSLTDIEYYGLRFGSVNGYAPNLRLDLMINSMVTHARKNKQVQVFNGAAHRPILGMNDLVRGIEAIINCEQDHRGIYNLASFNNNILNIGQQVAEYMEAELKNLGNNFTYDFQISSEKFIKTFDFRFTDSIQSIAQSILNQDQNPEWKKREKI